MSGGEARSQNRYGCFSFVFARTCQSATGPIADSQRAGFPALTDKQAIVTLSERSARRSLNSGRQHNLAAPFEEASINQSLGIDVQQSIFGIGCTVIGLTVG